MSFGHDFCVDCDMCFFVLKCCAMGNDLNDWDEYKRAVIPIKRASVALFRKIRKKKDIDSISEFDAKCVESYAEDAVYHSRYRMRCVDLHGLSREVAYDVVRMFLYEASIAAENKVLVITGGSASRGVLRSSLLSWLENDFAHVVDEYAAASPKHGGEGAFYIFLKRS